jgi:uncharacterized protein (DUF58 family)
MQEPRWTGSRAARRAALLCLLLPTLGAVTGRADVVLLAAPLVVGTALALASQLTGTAGGRGGVGSRVHAPGQVGQGEQVEVLVEAVLPPGAQAGVVRLPAQGSLPFGTVAAVGASGTADGVRRLSTTLTLPLWGAVLVARPDVRAVGADALVLADPVIGGHRTVRVLPAADRSSPAPLRPRTTGVVGSHRTRRAGEGLDLLDVREFRAGDAVRRIDWRVSARRGSLHVRRNALDADADVVVLLDTRVDVSREVARWPAPPGPEGVGTTAPGSSLDLSVRAAVTLTRSLLEQGDRVAVVDLSRPRQSVPPGTGRRQLRRVRTRLVDSAVHWQARRLLLRPGTVQPGMVAVLVSPLLDDAVEELALRLRRRGTEVVAVDTLPGPLDLDHPGSDVPVRDRTAARLVERERAERVRRLAAAGVVVGPAEASALARVLREVARRRRQVGR